MNPFKESVWDLQSRRFKNHTKWTWW